METAKISQLYDLGETIAAELFAGLTYPWEALPKISDFIKKLGPTLDPEVYEQRGESTGRPASAAAGSGICRVFRERSQYAAFLRDLRRPGEADLWQCERTGNGADP